MFLQKFRNYSMESLKKDLVSGVIVGVIAIPLGMAFAIASGVNPEYGIYTTIIAGILVSIFGGSSFQISGPTGAFIPLAGRWLPGRNHAHHHGGAEAWRAH